MLMEDSGQTQHSLILQGICRPAATISLWGQFLTRNVQIIFAQYNMALCRFSTGSCIAAESELQGEKIGLVCSRIAQFHPYNSLSACNSAAIHLYYLIWPLIYYLPNNEILEKVSFFCTFQVQNNLLCIWMCCYCLFAPKMFLESWYFANSDPLGKLSVNAN